MQLKNKYVDRVNKFAKNTRAKESKLKTFSSAILLNFFVLPSEIRIAVRPTVLRQVL